MERVEVLAGVADGVNVTFTAPTPYEPGSVRVFVRGLLRRQGDADGWTETDPGAGTITLAQAPLAGETVQAYYLDPTSTLVQSIVDGSGALTSTRVTGSLDDAGPSGAAGSAGPQGSVSSTAVTGRVSCP